MKLLFSTYLPCGLVEQDLYHYQIVSVVMMDVIVYYIVTVVYDGCYSLLNSNYVMDVIVYYIVTVVYNGHYSSLNSDCSHDGCSSLLHCDCSL